jgi:hypothetical protein
MKQFILLVITSIFLVCFAAKGGFTTLATLINPCKSGTYITIDSLYDYCDSSGNCGEKLACEGMLALIKGYVDYENVFDKKSYPQLPYQKFLMSNEERSENFEIWVDSTGSDEVFEKIAAKKLAHLGGLIYVKGVLVGFNMPIMGTCHRGLKLNLTGAASISYYGNGHLPEN